MLVLKLLKESLFLKVLEAILDLVHVVNVDCSGKGLTLQAVDSAEITVVKLFIPAEDFSIGDEDLENYYYCDEVLSMGIPIDDMVKAIGCADEDDKITIKVGDEINDRITLSFESSQNITMAYYLPVVDARDHLFYIPDLMVSDLRYQAIVKMSSAEFMRVFEYLNNIDGDVHISVTKRGLMFIAYGEIGDLRIKYKPEEANTNVTYDMIESVSLTLDLNCMYKIAKASTVLYDVKICLSTKHLLMVECKGSKVGEKGYMRYFLAPKVSAEHKEGSKDEPLVFN